MVAMGTVSSLLVRRKQTGTFLQVIIDEPSTNVRLIKLRRYRSPGSGIVYLGLESPLFIFMISTLVIHRTQIPDSSEHLRLKYDQGSFDFVDLLAQ